MTKVTFKATNAADPYKPANGWDVDIAVNDMDGIVEFLEIQHEENFEAPLQWAVRGGMVSAADGEGRYWVIIPQVELEHS